MAQASTMTHVIASTCRCLSCGSVPDRSISRPRPADPMGAVAMRTAVVIGGLAAREVPPSSQRPTDAVPERAARRRAIRGRSNDRSAVLGPRVRRDGVRCGVGRHDHSRAPRICTFNGRKALRNRDSRIGLPPRWRLRRAAPAVNGGHPARLDLDPVGWSHQQRHRWRRCARWMVLDEWWLVHRPRAVLHARSCR